jgi:2-polyprenyl-3-methyl-5-hydroxy-6-metoxy-1,4-benzoquinol methylase
MEVFSRKESHHMGRSRQEIQQEYDEFYTNDPNKWGGTARSDFMIKQLESLDLAPMDVLDFGCGQGFALENFHKKNPFANLYGVDISPVAIEMAKQRVPSARFTTEYEFEDIKQFDLVYCLGVAEHMEDLNKFFNDMKGWLTPKGVCYLEIPNCLSYSSGPETYRRLKVGSQQMEWHLKRSTWERLLHAAGFTFVKKIKGPKKSWEFIWILA